MSQRLAQQDRKAENWEIRCVCNRLLCITRGDIIEIKCPKCKRLISIHTRGIQEVKVVDEFAGHT